MTSYLAKSMFYPPVDLNHLFRKGHIPRARNNHGKI